MTDLERLEEIRRDAHDIYMENNAPFPKERTIQKFAAMLRDLADVMQRALDGRNR